MIVQLERLMTYPMVEQRVHAGQLYLHAWYYVIEDGQVLVLDAERGRFEPHEAKGGHDTASAARGGDAGAGWVHLSTVTA